MEANEAMKAMARTTTYAADELIEQLRLAADVFRPAGHAADELTALREALSAMCAAQQVEPYRGWNLTALNQATDKARALLGLPSVRELNPDIAAMQDHAAANKGAIAHLLTPESDNG